LTAQWVPRYTTGMSASAALLALREELSGRRGEGLHEAHTNEAFRGLLQRIVTLAYEPGRLLTEREIMGDLDVTRAPLRLAVAHLSDLGLIQPLPRKGLLVAPIDAFEVGPIYDARAAIEAKVARLAATKASAEEIEVLQAHDEAHLDHGDPADVAASFLAHDQAVHLALAAAAHNRYLEHALVRILPSSARMWHWVYSRLGPDAQTMFPHRGIVAAVAEGDPDGAEAAVHAHLDQSRQVLMKVVTDRMEDGRG